MIELPEAVVISDQMSNEPTRRRIAHAIPGKAPHKFAFSSGGPGDYARTRAALITAEERTNLYRAIRGPLRRAVKHGGRESERDLCDRPRSYRRILDSVMVAKPCPECGARIQKIQYLRGASYLCSCCRPPNGASEPGKKGARGPKTA